MARAQPQPAQIPPGQPPDPHEWQALRSELITLLEQVEGRYVAPHQEGELDGLAERMRDLREQVAEATAEPDSRRREALRSVKRAVDRLTDRDESDLSPPANAAAQGSATRSPRDALEAAINEIRARQQARDSEDDSEEPVLRAGPPANDVGRREPPKADLTPRFEDLARSVSGISGRLEKLEVELRAQRHDQASVREIAEQVSQVSQVVELLAGAVGETGQVKRLEGQIASLAKLISEGQRVDVQTLNRRLDDVSSTVEKLADIQMQQANREKEFDFVRRLDTMSATVERLADLQVQHVAREKDVPAIGAKLGEVSNTITAFAEREAQSAAARERDLPTIGARLGDVSRTMSAMADREAESAAARERDLPLIEARLGEVSQSLNAIAEQAAETASAQERDLPLIETRLGEVAQSIDTLAERQAEAAARVEQIPALGEQLGGVSQSIERLVDLQAMHVRTIRDVPAQQETLYAGIQTIEKSVRNVYDRIDAMERKYALTPQQLEELSAEVARFAQALEASRPPQSLLELVDLLNSRMSDIESHDVDVSGLKDDLIALRQSVLGAIEPRIAAIETRMESIDARGAAMEHVPERIHEMQDQLAAIDQRAAVIAEVPNRISAIQFQIEALAERETGLSEFGTRMADIQTQLEALNERVAERPAETSVDHIEAQVRQLVVRMDQTGEQLSGLARLYSEQSERETGADYETIAELVAQRTAEALARTEVPMGITAEDMSALEERMSRLIAQVKSDPAPAPDFSDVTEGIRRVDERLERLEDALTRLAEESSAAPVGFVPPPTETEEAQAEPEVELVAGVAEPQAFATDSPPRRSDAMPASPAEDRPLIEAPFPDSPMRVMVETRINPNRHQGLEDQPAEFTDLPPLSPALFGAPASSEPAISPAFVAQSFDPAAVVPPPRPRSSFEDSPETGFAEPPEETAQAATEGDELPPPSVTRSTFIEAARRAAQRQAQATSEPAGGNSLIGRALARFQQPRGEPKPANEPPAKPEKPAKAKKEKRAAKTEPTVTEPAESTNEPFTAAADVSTDVVPVAPREKPEAEPERESFLSRHRQPILLVASVVALSFLTLNLVNQRMTEAGANIVTQGSESVAAPEPKSSEAPPAAVPDASAVVATPSVAAPEPTIAPQAQASSAPPRVVGMLDSIATGSINASATKFTPSEEMPPVAQAFRATANADAEPAQAPDAIESPVKVDMPPEGVGPIDLRQAAADGDTRAQFEVGAIYTEGRAVPKDLKLAAMWYERAAAQGFAPAQYRLGNLYENGLGVTKDLEQARLWYQRAAEAGNRMSMHNLAALYAGGQLGKQDFAAAAEWFEKAANQGLTDSQFNLGMLYARGLGVPQNMETSYKWFALAARNGDKDAASARDDIAKSLLADNVSRLAGEVAAWKPEPIDLATNFAPIGTWSADFDPGETIKTRDVVLGVQTLLRRLGYDVGTPDGVAGPKTAEAIRQFEKATGMTETGAVNPRLLAVLSSQPV